MKLAKVLSLTTAESVGNWIFTKANFTFKMLAPSLFIYGLLQFIRLMTEMAASQEL